MITPIKPNGMVKMTRNGCTIELNNNTSRKNMPSIASKKNELNHLQTHWFLPIHPHKQNSRLGIFQL